ncbi:MAG: 1-deoxy-D-xylulose-5-phosphate synthase [Clostridiales bacterium]|nr:1-deoxy-D-xylulose-5-phosphate synthase [Clostridiales bacterium]
MSLLESIKTSSDLKKLSIAELKDLAEEIRQRILTVATANGGHLASNLGVVETTLAIHYVFDLPTDKLIFDVGHQCYAHKMLSGRNERFDSIRQGGGLSGFPNKDESDYDVFTVGHAGTSIAQGLGVCSARDANDEDYFVLTLVGDGSFINGLNLEAFYAKTFKPKKFVIILNDNGMSISKNKNGLYNFISKKTIRKGYIKSKGFIKKVFKNSFVTKILRKFRGGLKRLFNRNNYIESFGFKYVGLINGNDIEDMVEILKDVKNATDNKAVFLHVKTTKGKGYNEAEENASMYHGVGKDLKVQGGAFSKVVGETISKIIEGDKRVVAITAGMKDGTGLKVVEENHKDNFYDVGIAEEYAVTFAGGLAKGGLKPIVCMYSTFLQRSYDEIMHDVCLQNLPVVFCVDRAGFVGADGATHQGVYDLSYASHLPNLTILAPTTKEETEQAIEYALSKSSPVLIRYPNDKTIESREFVPFENGWEELSDGSDTVILAVGPRAVNIGRKVLLKTDKSVGLYSARTVKPLDEAVLNKIADKKIITIEENCISGGFGDAVMRYYALKKINASVMPFGAKIGFTEHCSIDEQFKLNGITVDEILKEL